MKNIILNCLPPFGINIPSPALSILKSHLLKNNFSTSVIYWNLLFHKSQTDFVWNNPKVLEDISNELAIYVNYIISKMDNDILQDSFKQILRGYSPHYYNNDYEYYESHITRFINEIDNIIDTNISKINFDETLFCGFSIKMDGWIAASIIAEKIKNTAPNIPIIIGGINTKKNAEVMLKNFPQFDIAMWGEGEMSIIELARTIDNKENNYQSIPNIAYREHDNIKTSNNVKVSFSNLSEENLYPNYDDYFLQRNELKINHQYIVPIEGSRGCHWNRCKFCYLNEDYKYRIKSVEKIAAEIRFMIKKYQAYYFEFLDNDFIGLDLARINLLLDTLIEIKKEEPRFEIVTVEVITKGLTHNLIKKMFDAGVIYAQIGYESTSHKLLNKIHKKNTFASNLFYVKIAHLYNVPLFFVNLIINMPDETTEDVIESIENLKFLRFFLNTVNFRHLLIPVEVNSISRYYLKVKNEIEIWTPSKLSYNYLINCFDKEYHWDIFSYTKQSKHYLWNTFTNVEKYYLENKHTYHISKVKNDFKYIEYINGIKNNELDIENNSIIYHILKKTNNNVISLDSILSELNQMDFNIKNIISSIDKLAKIGILFHSPDYTELVSIINFETE